MLSEIEKQVIAWDIAYLNEMLYRDPAADHHFPGCMVKVGASSFLSPGFIFDSAFYTRRKSIEIWFDNYAVARLNQRKHTGCGIIPNHELPGVIRQAIIETEP